MQQESGPRRQTEGGEAGIHKKGDEEDRSCEKAIQTKDDDHHWHQKAPTQGRQKADAQDRQKADAEAWSYFSKIASKKKVTGVKQPRLEPNYTIHPSYG